MNTWHNSIIEKYNELDYDSQVIFMNDGYLELDESYFPSTTQPTIKLNSRNVFFRYQAQLYYKTIKEGGVFTGTYLDLSCGRGGGVDFAKDNFNFEKIIGIDINPNQIQFCKSWCDRVEFLVGSATAIPLPDNSVDVISSIEAFPYYRPYDAFYEECSRILKKDGIITMAIPSQINPEFATEKMHSNFDVIKTIDITKNVTLACAMSKYIVPYHLNTERTKQDFKNIMFGDESRYFHNESKYIIVILKKKA